MMNPIIEVNGYIATGIWHTMGPWDLKEDGKEVWLACFVTMMITLRLMVNGNTVTLE